MSEAFLHYLWQFQYFDKYELQTTSGDPIQIFNPGIRNSNAGPDFQNARMKIGGIEWIGSAEIHIQASGWMEHKHDRDPAYDNVILHIVWHNDVPIRRSDGSLLPTLELARRVDQKFFFDYQRLVNSPEEIPCAQFMPQVKDIVRLSMMDKVVLERLETKSQRVIDILQKNRYDWEETCFQILARSFGYKINAEPFQQLARLLPYKVLRKHSDKLLHVEALLFGQAGFLEDDFEEDYYKLLRREHNLLRQKYSLSERRLSKVQWKFLRLRPANFPTIRLAEFAALIFYRPLLFSTILETTTYRELENVFTVKQSEFWNDHYTFSKSAREQVSGIGVSTVGTIIINAVAPLLVAYGKSKGEQQYVDRAVAILEQTPGEVNAIVSQWKRLGVRSKTAFDSQALLELQNSYCSKRRCLDCKIGVSLVSGRL
jgi:hypothetical protein